MSVGLLKRIYISVSRIFPARYLRKTEETLRYAGISTEPEIWLGRSLVVGVLVASAVGILSFFGSSLLFCGLALVVFIAYPVGSYFFPYFVAKDRADSVEESLPSALQLMASNVRAGMTPFQAMKFSARKEFGVLKGELDRATVKALGTASFSDALLQMSLRVKLPSLERSVRLFTRCIESGGHLAGVLEESARDISETRALKNELLASTGTYTMLILFVIVIGAPLLLTISIHFTGRLTEMRESIEVSDIEGMDLGMLVGGNFSPGFLVSVSTISIIFTSFIAGILIGVIKEGEEVYGLRYSIVLVPLTLVIFYLMRYTVELVIM